MSEINKEFLMMAVIASMQENEQNYTKGGKPDANVMTGLLGFDVSAKDRDTAFESFKKLDKDLVTAAVIEFERWKTEKQKQPQHVAEQDDSYLISVKKPATRRCRAGVCFEGQDTLVELPNKKQLKAWQDDDCLIMKPYID